MIAPPFVTPDLPGSGGAVKATPEDFRVDEVPAYLPAGAGPHLYVLVEKRGRTTRDAVRAFSRALGVPDRDAGYAGQKDKAAVTTQWLSFPAARDPDRAALAALEPEGFRVLDVSRHGNKLRTGHLRGNRFRVRVRGGDLARARACAAALEARGLANFYGPQRFGADGENARIGRALLTGADDPAARRAARDRFQRRLLVSAWQSDVFNRWLAARLADGLFDRALAGDVLRRLDSGGLFVCEDPATDGERVRRFELSPSGPMPGHRPRPQAAGEAARRIEALLAEEGVTEEHLRRGGGEAEGAWRAARLPVAVALEPDPDGDGYVAAFELPRGSYATVVLRELTKGEAGVPEEG